MNKHLRRIRVNRRFDSRYRRLMFERCEERLTLSGSSLVPVDIAPSEGGFISLNVGEYLSPPANNFIATDSLVSFSRYVVGDVPTITAFNSDSDAWTSSISLATARGFVLEPFYSVSPGIEIGTTIPVVDFGHTIVMSAFPSVLDVVTARTAFTVVTDRLSIIPLRAAWDDGAPVFSIGEAISQSSEITGEKPLTNAVANGESQINLVDAISVPLRFEPGVLLADQSFPQGGLSKPFSERPDHLFTNVQANLQPSGTPLAATTLNGTTDAGLSTHVSSSVVVDEAIPTTEVVEVLNATKTPRKSVVVVDHSREVLEYIVHGQPAGPLPSTSSENGDRIEPPSLKGDDPFTYSAEGGPIEVAQAVVDTQQAYEVKMFSAVAALLDEQDILALPTPPVRQPFFSELARSVAFETVEMDPTADSAHLDESHAPSAAAANVEAADTEPSRALAFAQWPLVFTATVGAVLVGSRRRSQPNAAQVPPRRNRQATVS